MSECEIELSDTRRLLQERLELLQKEVDDLSQFAWDLSVKLKERDAEIAELKATISRRERMRLDLK